MNRNRIISKVLRMKKNIYSFEKDNVIIFDDKKINVVMFL